MKPYVNVPVPPAPTSRARRTRTSDAVAAALTPEDRAHVAEGHHLRFKHEDDVEGGAVGPAWWVAPVEGSTTTIRVAPFRADVVGFATWVPRSALQRAAKLLGVKVEEV
jgi:hypothetical protein